MVVCLVTRMRQWTAIVRRCPIPLNSDQLERAGRVKGGAAAERSEGTLDAPEHSNMLTARGMGRSVLREQTEVHSRWAEDNP